MIRAGFFDEQWAPCVKGEGKPDESILKSNRFFGKLSEMNRRTFLAGTTGAATLATTLAGGRPPGDRKKVLIPHWEPEAHRGPEGGRAGGRAGRREGLPGADPRRRRRVRLHRRGPHPGGQEAPLGPAGQCAGSRGWSTIPELVERDIVLTNMQRTFAPEIADQAIAYLLAFTRGLTHFIRKPPEGAWRRPAGGRPRRAPGQDDAGDRAGRHRQRDRPPGVRLRDAGAGHRPEGDREAPVRRGAAPARRLPPPPAPGRRRRQRRAAHAAVEEDDRREGVRDDEARGRS